MTAPTCPRCGGRFEEGFLLDRGDHNGAHLAQWIEGAPEKSFWTGLRLKGRARHNVITHRCSRCGFLESYAPAS